MRNASKLSLVLLFKLGLAACAPATPTPCQLSRTPLPWNDTFTLGTSPELLVAERAALPPASGVWSDGETATVSVGLSNGNGRPNLAESVSGLNCPAMVEIPVVVAVSTDDGRLDEQATATWSVLITDDPGLQLTTALPLPLSGSLEPADIVSGGAITEVTLDVSDSPVWTGAIRVNSPDFDLPIEAFSW